MKPDSEETPFDSQMNDDLHSRRAQPTHIPVRIGPPTSPANPSPNVAPPVAPAVAPSVAPLSASPQLPDFSPDTPVKEGVPTPVILALAMAVGAVCVVGASIGMRRVIKPVTPAFPTVTALPPRGNVVMQSPDVVIKSPQPTRPSAPVNAPNDTEMSDATPSVEISELPPITAPTTIAPAATKIPRAEQQNDDPATVPETPAPATTTPPETYSTSESHRGSSFEITPPPGFRLRQSGRRTIWQRDDGAQILVETGKAGAGSPRAGWQKLDRDLSRRYGPRYRSLGIHEGTLAGHPAAIWEFELTGKDGITRRKIDVGIKINGRGYAVLGAAPTEKFDTVRGDIEQALDSFRVNAPADSRPEDNESSAPINQRLRRAPDADSPLPQPEKEREVERGY